MPDLMQKIREAKKAMEEARSNEARLEGQRDTIVASMKDKFGVKTEDGLKKKITGFQKEIKTLDKNIDSLEEELDEIMELAK